MSEVNVKSLENEIAKNKEVVKRREQVMRLFKNRDFRELVLEEFCVNEAARYVAASADPSLNVAQRADALALAQAAGHFKRWCSVQVTMGDHAEHEIHQLGQALDEERAAPADDEFVEVGE